MIFSHEKHKEDEKGVSRKGAEAQRNAKGKKMHKSGDGRRGELHFDGGRWGLW
jgi:hypothetical protein